MEIDDAGTNNNGSTNDINSNLAQIDSKMNFKFIKEGRHQKTYMTGLEFFIQEKRDRCKLCQELRKFLGAGSVLSIDENGKEKYSFQGDHIDKIKKYLTTKHNIPKDKMD